MKRNKIIAFVLAAVILISVTPVAFAADATVFDDIEFLYSHSEILPESTIRCLDISKEMLENPETSQREIEDMTLRVVEYRNGIEGCLEGNHLWVIHAETIEPPYCTSYGFCEYCTAEKTFISNSKYVTHEDKDKDDICDLCEKEMPYVNCNHFCHSNNIIIRKILLPIMKFIWEILDIEEYCECGMYHAHI